MTDNLPENININNNNGNNNNGNNNNGDDYSDLPDLISDEDEEYCDECGGDCDGVHAIHTK